MSHWLEEATPAGDPACNTGISVEIPYVVDAAGVDDLTVVLDLEGSKSLGKVAQLAADGRESRGGIVLDYEGDFGRRYSVFAPHFVTWQPRSKRLYAQIKGLGGDKALLPAERLSAAVTGFLMWHLGERGIFSYEPVKVSRLDYAVDLRFRDASIGRRFLDALHAAQWGGGYAARLEYETTVNVRRARKSGKPARIAARCYCRGTLHPELASPLTLIRLEREKHWKLDGERPAVEDLTPARIAETWREVFGAVSSEAGSLRSMPMEGLTMSILELVREGELGVAQAERVRMFLELERMGKARDFYGERLYAQRRREARKLGLTIEDALVSAFDLELTDMLAAATAATLED